MRTVPTSEPDTLVAGDTWRWRKTLAEYPPSEGWTLSYAITGASVIDAAGVTVVASGSGYDVTVAASATGLLRPGSYRWAAIVTSGTGETVTADAGVFVVSADPRMAQPGDSVTHAERMIALIEAVLENRVPSGIHTYQIAGRAVTSYTPLELRQLRAHYRRELWRSRHPGRAAQTVRITLGRVS